MTVLMAGTDAVRLHSQFGLGSLGGMLGDATASVGAISGNENIAGFSDTVDGATSGIVSGDPMAIADAAQAGTVESLNVSGHEDIAGEVDTFADQANGAATSVMNGEDPTAVLTDGISDTTTNVVRLQEGGAGSQQDANGFLIDANGAQVVDGAGNHVKLVATDAGGVTKVSYDAAGNQVAFTPTAAPVAATVAPVAATTTVAPVATTTVAPVAATTSATPVAATTAVAPVTATTAVAPVAAATTVAPVAAATTVAPVAATTTVAPVATATPCVNTQYSDGNIYCV